MEIPYPLSALDLCPLPVETVGRAEVGEFLGKVKELTGEPVRWPAEAEWEYACRAGTRKDYFFDKEEGVEDVAWYLENAGRTTHPVGEKRPNAWGLYDMHGNVFEWCEDWSGPGSSYPAAGRPDAAPGIGHVLRGGSWNYPEENQRTMFRYSPQPSFRSNFAGFRVLCDLPPEAPRNPLP